VKVLIDSALAFLVIIAVIADIRERRIPNWVVLCGIIIAILTHWYMNSWLGLLFCLKGLAVGILLLLLPYLMGGFGAGDVKLLGMIGALKGSAFVFYTFLGMAIAGGLIATVILLRRGLLKETASKLTRGLILSRLGICNLSDSADKKEMSVYFPYGLAIGLGVLFAFGRGWWG
jgi:prepilin peptidase CpaA